MQYYGPLDARIDEILGPNALKPPSLKPVQPAPAPTTGAAPTLQRPTTLAEDLAAMQPAPKPQGRSWGEFATDTAIDLGKGAIGLGEAAVGAGNLVTGNLLGNALEQYTGYDPKASKDFLSQGYSASRQAANQAVEAAEGFFPTAKAYLDNPSSAFGTIVESAPSMIAPAAGVRTLATSMLAKAGLKTGTKEAAEFLASPAVRNKLLAASAAGEGLTVAGQKQEEFRQEGLDWSESAPYALGAGVGTGLIGFGGAKIPGFRDVEVSLGTYGMGAGADVGLLAAGKQMAKDMFKEGVLEEMPQSAQEQVWTNLATGKPWDENVSKAAATGLVIGGAMGGAMSVPTAFDTAIQQAPPAASQQPLPDTGPFSRIVNTASDTQFAGQASQPNNLFRQAQRSAEEMSLFENEMLNNQQATQRPPPAPRTPEEEFLFEQAQVAERQRQQMEQARADAEARAKAPPPTEPDLLMSEVVRGADERKQAQIDQQSTWAPTGQGATQPQSALQPSSPFTRALNAADAQQDQQRDADYDAALAQKREQEAEAAIVKSLANEATGLATNRNKAQQERMTEELANVRAQQPFTNNLLAERLAAAQQPTQPNQATEGPALEQESSESPQAGAQAQPTIYNASGQPWKRKAAAEQALAKRRDANPGDTHRVAQVDGGFVLEPIQPTSEVTDGRASATTDGVPGGIPGGQLGRDGGVGGATGAGVGPAVQPQVLGAQQQMQPAGRPGDIDPLLDGGRGDTGRAQAPLADDATGETVGDGRGADVGAVNRLAARVIYDATNPDPLKDNDTPLSDEDADFVLESLQERAKRGKFTREVFAQSEIGQRLDTATLMAIADDLDTNPVQALQVLRERIKERKQAQEQANVPQQPQVQTEAPAQGQPAQAEGVAAPEVATNPIVDNETATDAPQKTPKQPEAEGGRVAPSVAQEGATKSQSYDNFKGWAIGRFGRAKAIEMERSGELQKAWEAAGKTAPKKSAPNRPAAQPTAQGARPAAPSSDPVYDVPALNMALRAAGEVDGYDAYTEAEMPDNAPPTLRAAEELLGVRIVPVRRTDGGASVFNGVTRIDGAPGVIYYDVEGEADVGLLAVVGHEFFHNLKQRRPDIYKWFTQRARKYYQNLNQFRADRARREGRQLSEPALEEELLADFNGDAWQDTEFLQDLAEDNPTLFRQFVNLATRYLSQVLRTIQAAAKRMGRNAGNDSAQYISDVKALQADLRQALRMYVEGQGGPVQGQGGMVFSAKKQVTANRKAIPAEITEINSFEMVNAIVSGQTFRTGRDLKLALDARVREKAKELRVELASMDEHTKAYLVDMVVKDGAEALKTNANAVGWYDDNVSEALWVMSLVHPEIETDANARFAFTWALAVTSNGLKVDKNFALAERAYTQYKKTGVMPTKIGEGTAAKEINGGLAQFNDAVTDLGFDEAIRFMTTKTTVRAIREATGVKITGENVDTEVYGSAILGPKIGNGFFSNLYGNFDQLTMDRWLMRTWGRWTGTLVEVDKAAVKDKQNKLRELIRMLSDEEKRQLNQAVGLRLKLTDINGTAAAIAKASSSPALREALNQIGPREPSAFDELLGKARKNIKRDTLGREIRKMGNGLTMARDGQKEAPTGGNERNFIREVFSEALNLLKRDNPTLTMADLQALLWYPEKRLYDSAKLKETVEGYTDDEAPNYANAARKVAEAKGIDVARARVDAAAAGRPTRIRSGNGGGQVSVQEAGQDQRINFSRRQADTRVIFEVAPDPNDAQLSGEWNKLDADQRLAISQRVVDEVLPDLAAAFNEPSASVMPQVGSYLDDTNPSFALMVENPANADPLSKGMGAALEQDSMMVVSKSPFPGSDPVGAVQIRFPDAVSFDEAKQVYDQLRQSITYNGEPVIAGQTTVGNAMLILNYSDMPTADLAREVSRVVRPGVRATYQEINAAFPERKDYGYASNRSGREEGDAGRVLRRRSVDNARARSQEIIREELRARSSGRSKFSRRRDAGTEQGAGDQGTYRDGVPRDGLPIRPDGRVPLTHWSRKEGLTQLDPNFYGTAAAGQERGRQGPEFIKRTYYGMPGYNAERDTGVVGSIMGARQPVYFTTVDPNDIIPLREAWDMFEDQIKAANKFGGGVTPTDVENAIRDAGYKGYYVTGGRLPMVVAMFEPLDVKPVTSKAVPDTGVWDESGALDRPQFSRRNNPANQGAPTLDPALMAKLGLAGPQRKSLAQSINNILASGWKTWLDGIKSRAYEGLFDGLHGIKKAEDDVGVNVGGQSGYVGARLAAGISDLMYGILHKGAPEWTNGIAQHKQGTVGLMEIMGDLGKDLDAWLGWMAGNRAAKLIREGRENNLTQADIQGLLAMRTTANAAKFDDAKRKYNQLNEAMLDFAEGAGLVDPAARRRFYDEWYIPFYRRADLDGDLSLLGPRTKQGLSHQSAGIKALIGGQTPTNDLLENIITNWLKLADSSMKNSALDKTLRNLDGSRFITNETLKYKQAIVPKREITKRIKEDRNYLEMVADMMGLPDAGELELLHELNQLDSNGFEKLWTLTAPTDPDVVRVQRNGKNLYFKVNDPALLRGLVHINDGGFQDPVTKTGRAFKRLLTTMVTTSPDFILRNFIRDAAHAWAINPDGFTFGKDSLTGLRDSLKQDPDYWKMVFAGASFQGGYVSGTDPEAAAEQIRRTLRQKGYTAAQAQRFQNSIMDTPAKLGDALSRHWQNYRELGDKVENANRLATLKASLDAGKPLAQALFEAKDLMDYSRRGNFALLRWFTDVIPFLNARMQGLDKLGRAGLENKRIVGMKVAKIAAFSVALAALNSGDDEYEELPDWDKDAYWHIFLWDEHVRIPKPFEIGIIGGTIPERMYHAWAGEQSNDKLLWSLQHNIMGTLAINPIPQAVLPIIETYANRSWFKDAPIEGMADEGKLPEARYNENTSNLMRELGEFTGMSPKKLQHVYNGYFGTMGAYALSAADMLYRGVSGAPDKPSLRADDIPVLRSFYRSAPARSTQWHTDMYDRLREVDQIYRTINSYKKEGKLADAKQLATENKEMLRYRKQLTAAQKQIGDIRKTVDSIYRSDLSAAEKRRRIDILTERSNRIAAKVAADTKAGWD
jgi:hypothetical protein